MEAEEAKGEENLRKLKGSRFRQNNIPQWRPKRTTLRNSLIFIIFAVIFLFFGILITYNSYAVETITISYSDITTSVNFDLSQKMEPPIYFYYQITNFHQNHRQFLESRSSKQLAGKVIDLDEAKKKCAKVSTMEDIYIPDGKNFNNSDVADPCGLMAKYRFNDTYKLQQIDSNTPIPISDKKISWPNIKGKQFKNPKNENLNWLDIEDERFINWMQVAPLSTFRKLWGRIETTLDAGNYQILISNNYNMERLTNGEGSKSILIQTHTFLGGTHFIMGVTYISLGSIFVVASVSYLGAYYISKRNKKDREISLANEQGLNTTVSSIAI